MRSSSENRNVVELSDREVEVLMHLIDVEMSGFCGDLGYQELSRLRSKLDSAQQSQRSWGENACTVVICYNSVRL